MADIDISSLFGKAEKNDRCGLFHEFASMNNDQALDAMNHMWAQSMDGQHPGVIVMPITPDPISFMPGDNPETLARNNTWSGYIHGKEPLLEVRLLASGKVDARPLGGKCE